MSGQNKLTQQHQATVAMSTQLRSTPLRTSLCLSCEWSWRPPQTACVCVFPVKRTNVVACHLVGTGATQCDINRWGTRPLIHTYTHTPHHLNSRQPVAISSIYVLNCWSFPFITSGQVLCHMIMRSRRCLNISRLWLSYSGQGFG